ncbi:MULTISPECIES: hypothetical protein [Bizionia]|uniref:Uncharacterized protein n=1 Tax=Bizionia algoritergicola TaxID=291187 RepID=A0A5D0QZF6_9FLAO|nr:MULTISPECIES: hypothetical protein [Bizionia]OBX20953.1 hypothetical protein BAA08_14535 [Bizionia sp. APA-3]TYB74597.1 hypothetical protein ES675_00185 [Bizionia algoritergicola]
MSKKTLKQGQSFLDKVTQLSGSIENALKESIANGVGITDEIPIGVNVEITEVTNKRVAAFFNQFNEPATAISTEQLNEIENIGIGTMIIEDTFIVA